MPTHWSDDITVCELADEPALSEELSGLASLIEQAPERAAHVVLDFSQVSYVNSSNLGQLLSLRKALDAHKRTVVLGAVSEQVMSVLRITGLQRVFRFAPDTLTALAMLQLDHARGD
ncbi:MAG: STAS domain-containing protein [Phycisphaerae bacterium]